MGKKRDWTKVLHKCQTCGETKPVNPGFSRFRDRGEEQPASDCKACREKAAAKKSVGNTLRKLLGLKPKP